MITICAYCNIVTGIDLTIPMDYPSHGICLDCVPGFLREGGFSEEEIKEIMKKEFGISLLND